MKTSAAGLAFLAQQEGTVLHVYKDIAGIPTIGVGHVLRPGESYPNGITQQQALDILSKDVATAENAINKDVKVTITQNMFDALVSFTFNLGTGALGQSTLLKLINENDDLTAAANQFLVWDHVVINGKSQESPALKARRERERTLFLTPDPNPIVVNPPVEPVTPAAPPVPTPVVPAPLPNDPSPVVQPEPSGWSSVWSFLMSLLGKK